MSEPEPTLPRVPSRRQASRYTRDLAERVFATFVMTFLSVWTVPVMAGGGTWETVSDLSTVQKAAVAALAAVLSLIKGAIAKAVGDEDSASLAPRV